jgi:hypothetical protein
MGENDLTTADKEVLLLAAGWMEDADGWWVKLPENIIRETVEEAYKTEFPDNKD